MSTTDSTQANVSECMGVDVFSEMNIENLIDGSQSQRIPVVLVLDGPADKEKAEDFYAAFSDLLKWLYGYDFPAESGIRISLSVLNASDGDGVLLPPRLLKRRAGEKDNVLFPTASCLLEGECDDLFSVIPCAGKGDLGNVADKLQVLLGENAGVSIYGEGDSKAILIIIGEDESLGSSDGFMKLLESPVLRKRCEAVCVWNADSESASDGTKEEGIVAFASGAFEEGPLGWLENLIGEISRKMSASGAPAQSAKGIFPDVALPGLRGIASELVVEGARKEFFRNLVFEMYADDDDKELFVANLYVWTPKDSFPENASAELEINAPLDSFEKSEVAMVREASLDKDGLSAWRCEVRIYPAEGMEIICGTLMNCSLMLNFAGKSAICVDFIGTVWIPPALPEEGEGEDTPLPGEEEAQEGQEEIPEEQEGPEEPEASEEPEEPVASEEPEEPVASEEPEEPVASEEPEAAVTENPTSDEVPAVAASASPAQNKSALAAKVPVLIPWGICAVLLICLIASVLLRKAPSSSAGMEPDLTGDTIEVPKQADNGLSEQVASLNAELQKERSAVEELRGKVQTLEESEKSLQEKVDNTKKDKSRLLEQLASIQSEKDSLKEMNEDLKAEKKRLVEMNSNLTKDLSDNSDAADESNQKSEEEISRLTEEVSKRDEQITDFKLQIADLKQKVEDSKQQLAEVKKESKSLEEQIEERDMDIDAYQQDIKKFKADLNASGATMKALTQAIEYLEEARKNGTSKAKVEGKLKELSEMCPDEKGRGLLRKLFENAE